MSDQHKPKGTVEAYYDATTRYYAQQYERDQLFTSEDYPANYFRLQLLINSFVNKKIQRVIDVGVGEGTPLLTLAKAGIESWGFDLSHNMVEKAKANLTAAGLDPERIFWGDVQDPATYVHALKGGQFDGLMAMGVMPHVENDDMVLSNMATLVRPGGSVFIEFRNSMFSMFTFNRHTANFILNDLLKNVDEKLKQEVAKELAERLRMDLPPVRASVGESQAPGFDAILSKFHNPFEVIELFKRHNFEDIQLRWYHYHPAMPYLEAKDPKAFRAESFRLEHESSNWRGLFLCSAFVVEAVKKGG